MSSQRRKAFSRTNARRSSTTRAIVCAVSTLLMLFDVVIASVTSLTPSRGPLEGNTRVTARGTFAAPANWENFAPTPVLSHAAGCKFGFDGMTVAYSAGTVIASDSVECATPAYGSRALTGSRSAAVSVTFKGFPYDPESYAGFFSDAQWFDSESNVTFEYYDAPIVREVSIINSATPKTAFVTGEAPSGEAAVVAVDGGPFLADGDFKCRFALVNVINSTFVNATRVTCPMCDGGANGCGAHNEQLSWLLNPPPEFVEVEVSMNGGGDYHSAPALKLHTAAAGVTVTHTRSSAALSAYESTVDSGATTMTLDPLTVNLVDAKGTVIADDLGVGGSRGFEITATLNSTLSASTPGVTMTMSPTTVTTTDGEATFQLVFSAPLRIGDYVVNIHASDCTGSACVVVPSGTIFKFSVVPGAPAGLVAVPMRSRVVPVNDESSLGVVTVYVVDSAGNRLYAFDETSHSISVASVDGSDASRTTGSVLFGSTTMSTAAGVAVFRDLKFVNEAPTGERRGGETMFVNNLTHPSPSRGLNGVDEVYRLLFTASFGSTISSFTMANGRARYVEIDNHVMQVMVTSTTVVTLPSPISLRLYDAGYNAIAGAANARLEVRMNDEAFTLSPSTATYAVDASGSGVWTFAANTVMLQTKSAGYYVVEFGLEGSEYVRPARQLVQLIPGSIGYRWSHSLASGPDVRYANASTPLGNLTVSVADVGGSLVGASDRFNATTSSFSVHRMFACNCPTLSINGTLTGDTAGTGAAVLSGLVLQSPALGIHTFTCSSTGNTLKDSAGNVFSTNSVALVDLNFNITVTSGVPHYFALTNSPVALMSTSFGVMNMSTFRRYSSDYYVPLDDFKFQMYDAYSNEVNYLLTSNPVHLFVHYASGVSGDDIGTESVYVTYNSTVAKRIAHLVADPFGMSTGLNVAFDYTTNAAAVVGLALERATVGTHTLTFSVPSMSAFSNVTQSINVSLGRAHHLAARAPCDDYYLTSECSSAMLTRSAGTPCTCTQYKSSALVQLDPIVIVVMDGGDNLMGSSYSPNCLPGEASCTGEVEAVFDFEATNPCVSSAGACAASQPFKHKKPIVNGQAVFDDIAFRFPRSTIHGGTATITFRSPGLVDVQISYEIWPGDAYALKATIPDSYPGDEDGDGLPSNFFTLIGSFSRHFVLNVVDQAGNKLLGEDVTNRTVTASVVSSTATMEGTLEQVTSAGSAVFRNFYFTSPPHGSHIVRFSTSGLQSDDLKVKIVEGTARKIKHIVTLETRTSYSSRETIEFGKFTIHLQDAGGTLVENNFVATDITASLRATFNSSRTSTTVNYAVARMTAPLGRAVLVFRGLTASHLEQGTYTLTFSGEDMITETITVTITTGVATQLYAPPMSTLTGRGTYERQTSISAARVVVMNPFAAVVVDGGMNAVGSKEAGVFRIIKVKVEYAVPTNKTVFSQAPQSMTYSTSDGEALITGVTLYNPIAGLYKLTLTTVSPNVLQPATFNLTITAGEISSLDVCGCPTCVRRAVSATYPTGLCTDTQPYLSADNVNLNNVVAVTRDSAGLLMGSALNSAEARRAVSVKLTKYSPSIGEEVAFTLENSPLIATETEVTCVDAIDACNSTSNRVPSASALYVQNGVAAWCAPGTASTRAKSFCRPVGENATESLANAEILYVTQLGSAVPDIAGTSGEGLDYYGVRQEPGFIGDAVGLKLHRPLAGRYVLSFASLCPSDVCTATTNDGLIGDTLEITVVPGVQHRLEFGTQKIPRHFDSNITFPAFEISGYDVADNLLTNLVENVTVTVTPTPHAVLGGIEPLQNGRAKFGNFKIIGRRGMTYSLVFNLGPVKLNVPGGVTIFSCEQVKPHSRTLADGTCECFPGYTEDVNRTGFVNSTATSTFPNLYSTLDPSLSIDNFFGSLRPYGVCVPCDVGFFKSSGGAQACDECPVNMDTLNGANGEPIAPHVTVAGETLPGYLANVNISACQCTLRGPAVGNSLDYESFYRLFPFETYTCASCPAGAVCDSRDITELSLLPGKWRVNRTTLDIKACRSPNSCKGGRGETNDLCHIGYIGPLCGTCDASSGYATLADSNSLETSLKCTKCWGSGLTGLSIFIVIVLQITVAYFVCKAVHSGLATQIVYTKSIISHFHMLSTLGSINLGWTEAAGFLLSLSRCMSTTSLKSFVVDCASKWSHVDYTRYSFVAVGVFCALCVPLYLYIRLVYFFEARSAWYEDKRTLENAYITARREGEDVDRIKWQLERIKQPPDVNDSYPDAFKMQTQTKVNKDGYVVQEWTEDHLASLKPAPIDVAYGILHASIFSMCWFPVVTDVLKLVRSTKVADIGSFLFVDYKVRTDTSEFEETSIVYFIAGFVVAFLLPSKVFSSLKSHKSQLAWAKTKARYGFMYIGFTEERYYWEFIVMMRKALLAMITLLLPDRPILAAYLCIALLQGSLALALLLDVYERERHRHVEVVSLTVILISYNTGALVVNVNNYVLSVLATLFVYALNLSFLLTVFWSIRGDITQERIASKIEAESKALEGEDHLRRDAIRRALVDTHEAAQELHPSMAEQLIASFDDQTLIEELAKPGANDLKLKYLQLNVHLEGLRNKWRNSKSLLVHQPSEIEHKIETLAAERRRHANNNRSVWRGSVGSGAGSSSDSERKSASNDDSAYINEIEIARRGHVEARVAQYNELIAQQLRIARNAERDELLGPDFTANAAAQEQPTVPLYPAGYIPPTPRLPAQDTVSWTPPSAEVLLNSSKKLAKKPAAAKPSRPFPAVTVDPFTHEYFELAPVGDELSTEARLAEIEEQIKRETGPETAVSAPRKSWRDKMTDTRWRVQKRIEARETAAMRKAFAGDNPTPEDLAPASLSARSVTSNEDKDEDAVPRSGGGD